MKWKPAGKSSRLGGLLGLALLLALTACSGYVAPRYTPQEYPASYKSYDISLFWKSVRQPGSVTIAGFVRNTRYAVLGDLELTAILLDADGRELGKKSSLIIPTRIAIDETVPFDLTIRLKQPGEPKRLRFFYRYRMAERDYDTSPYSYYFEVDFR